MLAAADSQFVRRDSVLPGLATMLDTEAFVAALRPLLPAAQVETARIDYVRYKPTKTCIVAYRLSSAGGELTAYAKAHPVRRQGGYGCRSLRPRRFALEDGAITVSIFPTDTKLPAIAALADPLEAGRWLRELLPDCPNLWDGVVQRLRYMPERRYVARLLSRGQIEAALKVYIEREYEAVRTPNAFESRGPLRLARRLNHSDVHRVVILEWLPGQLLSDAIVGPDCPLDAMERVGAALAELQNQRPAGLAELTRVAESATLVALSVNLGFVLPHLAERFAELSSRLSTRLSSEGHIGQPIHGDFYAKQVLLVDDAVAVLDLDRAVLGDPTADLGLFLAHLERDTLEGRLTATRMEALREALLQGYQSVTRQPISDRLRLYVAIGLFRLTADPFRFRVPDWPQRIEALLERANGLSIVPTHGVGSHRPDCRIADEASRSR